MSRLPRGLYTIATSMDRLIPSAGSAGAIPDNGVPLRPQSAPLRLGRAADNAIVIADPNASRFHALLEYQAPDWVLTDVSRHGTRRKSRDEPGEELRGTSARLRHGDRLGIGNTELFFVRGGEPLGDVDDLTPPLAPKVPLPPRRYAALMELSRPLRSDRPGPPASNAEIATALFVTGNTVREHLKALYESFEIPSKEMTPAQSRALLASQWHRAVVKGSEQE